MSHRLRVFVCGAVAVAAMVLSTAAFADKPLKEPIAEPAPMSFAAGEMCAFPVTLVTTSRTFTITHFDKAGDVRWTFGTGTNIVRVINDSTGKSVTVNASGPGEFIPNDDGTLTLVANGTWLLAFFPTDDPAASLLLLTGRSVLSIDTETGKLALVSHVGTTRDLCAELA